MLFEILIGFVLLFSLLNLVITWINLNLQIEIKEGIVHFLQSQKNPAGDIKGIIARIDDIYEFLNQLMQVMGNPFQMLAATHGARILDRIFPPKFESISEERSHGDISTQSPSGEAWQDVEEPLREQDEGEVPE